MSDITPFDFQGHAVRVLTIDGEPWWVAADVCVALGISNSRDAIGRLHSDDVGQTDISSGGQNRAVNIVNESGLYELIIRSDKPEARPFRRWVTAEVLPQIRKTGSYAVALSPAELILQQAQALVGQERRMAVVERRQEAIEQMLGEQVAERAELVARTDALEENHDRVTAVGYANLRKIRSDVAYLNRLGRNAARIARRDGVPVSKAHSTVWGDVNAWPMEIWDEALDQLRD